MQVSDVMTDDVTAFATARTIAEVAMAMRDLDIGSLPIVEDGQLVGVITDRDIVLRVVADGLDPHLETVGLHMTRNPTTIGASDSIDDATEVMAREQVRRLPVVENGQLVGYLALADIAKLNEDQQVGDTLENISQ